MAAEISHPVPKGKLWPILRLTGAFIGVAILSSCATTLFGDFSAGLQSKPVPTLLQNAPVNPNDHEADQKFTRQLTAKFPIGSSESALVKELWNDGFQPTKWGVSDRDATFDDPGICREDADISWSIDASGNITKLHGSVVAVCL
jgi:hypothetical protein